MDEKVRDRTEEGIREGSRKPSAKERGGHGCDGTSSSIRVTNSRETKTFQGGTVWLIHYNNPKYGAGCANRDA